eukprot:CAMPEP_0119261042 /NCGR_PEP_ID=MMETSP1329-20130426/1225_1 /TAXON_ID=114041 /ORGANISM="Genus nov. species nov., Strain RCC1024" /LENGTH=154 /DNA_ID=CAMNT_0007260537 /DNA_START=297 /DNA_END=758 /DNA_ORIENTATION=-
MSENVAAATAALGELNVADAEAARRAEIMKKVAEARAAAEQKKKAAERQRTEYYGEHPGISCDGCGLPGPLQGFRYRCRSCPNHDVCEACYAAWDGGKGKVENALSHQKLSLDAKDHYFEVHKDKGFKPMIKGAGATTKISKVKPNEPCPCGSG